MKNGKKVFFTDEGYVREVEDMKEVFQLSNDLDLRTQCIFLCYDESEALTLLNMVTLGCLEYVDANYKGECIAAIDIDNCRTLVDRFIRENDGDHRLDTEENWI